MVSIQRLVATLRRRRNISLLGFALLVIVLCYRRYPLPEEGGTTSSPIDSARKPSPAEIQPLAEIQWLLEGKTDTSESSLAENHETDQEARLEPSSSRPAVVTAEFYDTTPPPAEIQPLAEILWLLEGKTDTSETSLAENRETDQEAPLEPSSSRPAKTSTPTSPPSLTPTIMTVPHDLLPKLPEIPAFNFTVAEANGCETTGEAVLTNYPKEHPLDRLVEIIKAGNRKPFATDLEATSDKKPRDVVCKFRKYGNYLHFPHTMQAFARCFSYFQAFSNHAPHIVKTAHRNYRRDFNEGLLNIFKHVFHGKVSNKYHALDKDSLAVRPMYDPGMEEGPQQGIAFQHSGHAELLRQKTAEYYNITVEGCQPGKEYPVIAILNRRSNSSRSLINADQLQKYLSKMTDRPVEIAYFEERDFLDQVSFMMQTDILISPHGAQLTSINFMSMCGGVFEIFPPGYWLPHFFGPLAATSGLEHGYVYTGHDLQTEWFEAGFEDKRKRGKARRKDVCAPLETTLRAVGQMVDKWKTCCHHNRLKHRGQTA